MTLEIRVVVVAVLALLPATAWAQSLQRDATQTVAEAVNPDPVRLARRCAQMIEGRADRGVAAIAETTEGTMQRIRRLHGAGASDREILAAGRAGAGRVERIAAASAEAIGATTRRCVVALTIAGADRRLIWRVLGVSESASESVRAASERAQTAIRQTVRRALG